MESQADSSGSLSTALPIPAPKKRKRELDGAQPSTKKGFPPAQPSANHATWTNGSAATSATVGQFYSSDGRYSDLVN
jgi:hypothetical protein